MEQTGTNGDRDRGIPAWRAFLQAHAALTRRLAAQLDGEGLVPLGDLDVLIQLAGAPGHHLRMGELADRALLSRSGMTRRVDRLEAQGLVERRSCSLDRRGAEAYITRKGVSELRRALPTHLEGVREHFAARLSDDELAMVEEACTRLAGEQRAAGTRGAVREP